MPTRFFFQILSYLQSTKVTGRLITDIMRKCETPEHPRLRQRMASHRISKAELARWMYAHLCMIRAAGEPRGNVTEGVQAKARSIIDEMLRQSKQRAGEPTPRDIVDALRERVRHGEADGKVVTVREQPWVVSLSKTYLL